MRTSQAASGNNMRFFVPEKSKKSEKRTEKENIEKMYS
jgi:hypothetical protein